MGSLFSKPSCPKCKKNDQAVKYRGPPEYPKRLKDPYEGTEFAGYECKRCHPPEELYK